MIVLFVHHSEALDSNVDPQRPLSPRGLEQARALARAVEAREAKPAVFWHSGKLRARQTAEIIWRAVNPLAQFVAVRGLQPGDPVEWVAGRLRDEDRDLLVAGHMPHLPLLVALLVGEESAAARFPPHGLVALERTADSWQLSWTAAPPV